MANQVASEEQLIEHELDGSSYTLYYTEFEWAMDLSSRELWEALKDKAQEITCVTKQDPDYRNPICFPHYTPECESDKYRIKTFKINEKDYVAQYAELFKEYHQVKGLPRITLNFQKTAFLKDEDTLIHLNPWKEMTILFILFDHFIAVQDGESRRFLIGHPLKKLPPSLLERHSRTYSPELNHLLNLILEIKNAPDSSCFILIDRYQNQTLNPITRKEYHPDISETFSVDKIIGFEVSNGDYIDVVENELIQDYQIAAFRCHTVQIYINGQLLETLSHQLQPSTVLLSCITSEGMVKCIPYPLSELGSMRKIFQKVVNSLRKKRTPSFEECMHTLSTHLAQVSPPLSPTSKVKMMLEDLQNLIPYLPP